jgi:hypothetical protein
MFIKINTFLLFLNIFDRLQYFSLLIINMLVFAAHLRSAYWFLFGNPELKFRNKIFNQITAIFKMVFIVWKINLS